MVQKTQLKRNGNETEFVQQPFRQLLQYSSVLLVYIKSD